MPPTRGLSAASASLWPKAQTPSPRPSGFRFGGRRHTCRALRSRTGVSPRRHESRLDPRAGNASWPPHLRSDALPATTSPRRTSSTRGLSGNAGGVPVAVTIRRGRRRGDIRVRRGGRVRNATRGVQTLPGGTDLRAARNADPVPRHHVPSSPAASLVTDLVTSVTCARRRRWSWKSGRAKS